MDAGPLESYCRILVALHEHLMAGTVASHILRVSRDKAWNRLGERERSLASEFAKSLAIISHAIMRERSASPNAPPTVDDPVSQAVTESLGPVAHHTDAKVPVVEPSIMPISKRSSFVEAAFDDVEIVD